MIKIKVFDISLTMLAFAALIFLLPPDKEISNVSKSLPYTSSPSHGDSKTAHQSPVRVDILRTT
jgi:hypothetical protein